MSETEIYAVLDDGNVYYQCGLQNSWRGSMNIWNELARKWFGWENFPLIEYQGRTAQAVWDLSKDERLPLNDRIVLLTTFDMAMAKSENLPALIEAMEDFATRYKPGSLLEHANVLRKLAKMPECIGVCWNWTSVCAGLWTVYDTVGDDDRAYNIHADTGHWYIFDDTRGDE